jgi:hypothetical protein
MAVAAQPLTRARFKTSWVDPRMFFLVLRSFAEFQHVEFQHVEFQHVE